MRESGRVETGTVKVRSQFKLDSRVKPLQRRLKRICLQQRRSQSTHDEQITSSSEKVQQHELKFRNKKNRFSSPAPWTRCASRWECASARRSSSATASWPRPACTRAGCRTTGRQSCRSPAPGPRSGSRRRRCRLRGR